MLRQLTELQLQKQDVTGESQKMSLKYDNAQREVLDHEVTNKHCVVLLKMYYSCNFYTIYHNHYYLPSMQLTQALREIEELKLQLVSSQENWEHERFRLKEDM